MSVAYDMNSFRMSSEPNITFCKKHGVGVADKNGRCGRCKAPYDHKTKEQFNKSN